MVAKVLVSLSVSLGLLWSGIVCWESPAEAADTAENQNVVVAKSFLSELGSANFEKATAFVQVDARKQLTSENLSTIWKQLQTRLGDLKSTEFVSDSMQDKFDIVKLKCTFANGQQQVTIPLNEAHEVCGFFLPAGNPNYAPPDYVKKESFREESITVGAGKYALPGTVTIPTVGKAPYPVVVLVHGSGPNDRDETIGPNRPFRDLAWGLASKGIVVVRYDKRNFAHPAEVKAQSVQTMENNVTDDAGLAVDLAMQLPYADKTKVFLLGHSLGAYLAPYIAKAHPQLAGIIVMSGPARPQEDVIMEQMEYLSSVQGSPAKSDLEPMREKAAKIKKHDFNDTTPASELLLFPGSLWTFFNAYDPVKAAAELKTPVLVLQGERDYQVTMADFTLWKSGLSKSRDTFKSYPTLNHLYQEGTVKAIPSDYVKEAHIPGYVVDDITNWIRSTKQ